MKITLTRKQKIIFWMFLMSAFALNIFSRELVLVTTPSIKPTLLIKSEKIIIEGTYASFTLNSPIIGGKRRITKKVGCNEGQYLKSTNQKFYCGSVYLGKAKTHSKNGHVLPMFVFDGVIPRNKAFLIGEHSDSFDSRYFGFIDKNNLEPLTVLF